MSWHVDATLTGSMGVALLLVAFLLNLAKVLRSDEWPYLGLNVVVAGLACYFAYFIQVIALLRLHGACSALPTAGPRHRQGGPPTCGALPSGSRGLRAAGVRPGAAGGKDIPGGLALARVGRKRLVEPRCASERAGAARIPRGTEREVRVALGRRQDGSLARPRRRAGAAQRRRHLYGGIAGHRRGQGRDQQGPRRVRERRLSRSDRARGG